MTCQESPTLEDPEVLVEPLRDDYVRIESDRELSNFGRSPSNPTTMFCPEGTFPEAGDIDGRCKPPKRTRCPERRDRDRQAPALHAGRAMTCRRWSALVVLGSVLIAIGTPGCAKKLVRSSPGVVGSMPLTVPGTPVGVQNHASADAQRRPLDKADGVRPSAKAINDPKRRAIAAGRERLDRGLSTSTASTAGAGVDKWSVVVTTPAPALADGGRGPAVASGTSGSAPPSHLYRAGFGLGLTAATAIVLALIAAIVVVPKFLDRASHRRERPRA
jgi:hypothetical protein